MTKSLYRYVGTPLQFAQSEYHDAIRTERHAGDIVVRSDRNTELHLESAIDHPITLTHFTSRNAAEVTWRRSKEMIRAQGGAFILFRFPVRGFARSVTSAETVILDPSSFNVTRGDVPYCSQMLPDEVGIHESFQIWIPLHRIAHALPKAAFEGAFSRQTPTGATANALLQALFAHGGSIDFPLREAMAEALISALIGCVHEQRAVCPPPNGTGKAHVAKLHQIISTHAMNADLTAEAVAEHCGISRRYMTSLFASEGLHFSDILRKARLERAEILLGSQDAANRTVSEIALLSGFHSAAYFSRVFKASCGKSPRRFRVEQLAKPVFSKVDEPTWRALESSLDTAEHTASRRFAAG